MGRAGTGPWPSAEDAAVGEEVGLPPEHVEVQLSPLEASILVPLLSSAPKSVFSHPIHFFGCCLQVVSGTLEKWSKQPIGGYETSSSPLISRGAETFLCIIVCHSMTQPPLLLWLEAGQPSSLSQSPWLVRGKESRA